MSLYGMKFILGKGYDRIVVTVGADEPRRLTKTECDELDTRDHSNEVHELMGELDRRLGPHVSSLKYPA